MLALSDHLYKYKDHYSSSYALHCSVPLLQFYPDGTNLLQNPSNTRKKKNNCVEGWHTEAEQLGYSLTALPFPLPGVLKKLVL